MTKLLLMMFQLMSLKMETGNIKNGTLYLFFVLKVFFKVYDIGICVCVSVDVSTILFSVSLC